MIIIGFILLIRFWLLFRWFWLAQSVWTSLILFDMETADRQKHRYRSMTNKCAGYRNDMGQSGPSNGCCVDSIFGIAGTVLRRGCASEGKRGVFCQFSFTSIKECIGGIESCRTDWKHHRELLYCRYVFFFVASPILSNPGDTSICFNQFLLAVFRQMHARLFRTSKRGRRKQQK